MIKYLGSKRLLLPLLTAVIDALDAERPVRSVADLFSGTARVGHALKARGYRVLANDHNAYAATLSRCYVQADAERHTEGATALLAELAVLPPAPGWFTRDYCERARFLHPDNGARVEAMRAQIAAWQLEPELEAVLLTALMQAADRVDSTVGVQMAYLKRWAPRAHNRLELRLPELLPRARHGAGEAHQLDAEVAAATLDADVAYLDPPYNQHSYLGNYHVWETLVRWDAPEVYGVACKRVDVRTRPSAFNRKGSIAAALQRTVDACRAERLVVSFSDEGAIGATELVTMLRRHGVVTQLARSHGRYIGSAIGIYDPSGRKVGRPGPVRNVERVFVVAEAPLAAAPALVRAGLCDAFEVAG